VVIKVFLLGAGNRGTIYSEYIAEHSDIIELVGVADPNKVRAEKILNLHHLSESAYFSDWEDFCQQEIEVDAVIISLPDNLHFKAAKYCISAGYHCLLEKPIATNPVEVKELVTLAEQTDKVIQVCHVLRYSPFYQKIKQLLDKNILGEIISVEMAENVSYYHYAHSYIRGNWANRDQTAPMILTKCSHDLDLMIWLLRAQPKYLSSFGNLHYFGKKNKPDGAPSHCTDGCPIAATCPYYAPRIYLDIEPLLHANRNDAGFAERTFINLALKYPRLKNVFPFSQINSYDGWPVNVITEDPTYANRLSAIQTGPYGRCVYDVDEHNVIDNQVVSLLFDNEVTVSFRLIGHSSEEERTIRIDGTLGTLKGRFSFTGNHLELIDKLSGDHSTLINHAIKGGHGGGDQGIMDDFVANIQDPSRPVQTSLTHSSISHMMAFAADLSRLTSETVEFVKFRENV